MGASQRPGHQKWVKANTGKSQIQEVNLVLCHVEQSGPVLPGFSQGVLGWI